MRVQCNGCGKGFEPNSDIQTTLEHLKTAHGVDLTDVKLYY